VHALDREGLGQALFIWGQVSTADKIAPATSRITA
jgi:hypothetical protein